VWGFEKILGDAGERFLSIVDLKWVKALKLNSKMTCDVGIKPQNRFFGLV
jgi:hypothetical protein